APMAAPALGELDGVAVWVVNAHRSFPRLVVRRFEELHPASFQLLIKPVEMVGTQFDMDTLSLPRGRALRSQWIPAVVNQQADGSTRSAPDADHRELRSLVDLDCEAKHVSVEFDRARHVGNTEREPFQSDLERGLRSALAHSSPLHSTSFDAP